MWPLQEAVTPFTFSLLVYALPLLGIYMNSRDRVVAVHGDSGAGRSRLYVRSGHELESRLRR